MKTFLAGIALAIAMLFAFEAFAMPYCTGGTSHAPIFRVFSNVSAGVGFSRSRQTLGNSLTFTSKAWKVYQGG